MPRGMGGTSLALYFFKGSKNWSTGAQSQCLNLFFREKYVSHDFLQLSYFKIFSKSNLVFKIHCWKQNGTFSKNFIISVIIVGHNQIPTVFCKHTHIII